MTKFKIETKEILLSTNADIVKSVKEVGDNIQTQMVKLMKYTAATRDCGPAFDLYWRLANVYTPKGGNKPKSASIVRVAAVKRWLSDFAFCIEFTNKKTGKKSFRLNKEVLDNMSAEELAAHFANASKVRWNKYTPDADFKPIDLTAAINSLIKRVDAALNDNDVPAENKAKHKVDADMFASLKALVA